MSGALKFPARHPSCLERPSRWDGNPLPEATLLLIADQGLGDSIRFSRYIPKVLERCPRVVVVADPLLHPLIRQVYPEANLIDRWEQCPPFAVYCPLSGLPRLFRHKARHNSARAALSSRRA